MLPQKDQKDQQADSWSTFPKRTWFQVCQADDTAEPDLCQKSAGYARQGDHESTASFRFMCGLPVQRQKNGSVEIQVVSTPESGGKDI